MEETSRNQSNDRLVEGCINLFAQDLPEDSDNQANSLCPVCRAVDWANLGGGYDSCCGNLETRSTFNVNRFKSHFHFGPVWKIVQKQYCPGCRLIAACISSFQKGADSSRVEDITNRHVILQAKGSREKAESSPGHYSVSTFTGAYWDVSLQKSKGSAREHGIGRLIQVIGANEPDRPKSPGGSTYFNSSSISSYGRTVGPEPSIELIQQWKERCDLHHGDTCRNLYKRTATTTTTTTMEKHPIRLIDVKDYKIIEADISMKYVALSYVWGHKTRPLMTKETGLKYSTKGSLEDPSIPRTISDAIHVVQKLGERCLWVDSLCIIQDDPIDILDQLTIMDRIYMFADLVIVAAAGENANCGLPGLTPCETRSLQRTETVGETTYISAQPSLSEILKRTKWNKRGWTYQEMLLSRRLLLFTSTQMYWNCRSDSWCEDMSIEDKKYRPIDDFDFLVENSGLCRTYSYCERVQMLSHRHFTHKKDSLWAFMGVLMTLKPLFPRGFIWGVPYEKLDSSLLWQKLYGCSQTHRLTSGDDRHIMKQGKQLYELPFPSWSFLATNAPIKYIDPCSDSTVSRVEWHEPILFKQDGNTPQLYQRQILEGDYSQKSYTGYVSSAETAVTDFGLLQFTAGVAVLGLRYESSRDDKSLTSNEELEAETLDATVHLPSGQLITHIEVPKTFFPGETELQGEFILLSDNAESEEDEHCKIVNENQSDCGNIAHVYNCRHIKNQNIMLIEWKDGIAYRVGLTTVGIDDGKKIQFQPKKIILG